MVQDACHQVHQEYQVFLYIFISVRPRTEGVFLVGSFEVIYI